MWVTKANLIVYCSHFLYSWGARMWMFAISMFLVRVAEDSMQLSATYGLASGLAIFFFGAIVGDWVDTTPRLKAAQLSLAVQYLLMLGCTGVVAVYLRCQPWPGDGHSWLPSLLRVGMVALGVLSDLASQTRVIVVERDWVVEICAKDPDHLASMTAMLRRLDLITMVLAPLAMGQVMEHLGLLKGALFMGGWTLASLLLQLLLTWKVYRIVPALRDLKSSHRAPADAEQVATQDKDQQTTETPMIGNGKHEDSNKDNIHQTTDTNSDHGDLTPETLEIKTDDAEPQKNPDTVVCSETGNLNKLPHERADTEHAHSDMAKRSDLQNEETREPADAKATWCARASKLSLFHQVVTLYRGGRTYLSYTVALPGLSLACLYLTVLSFDNITVAYIVTQGLSESTVGITMSASAVFGVLSTFAYTFLRRRLGLVRAGFLGLVCEVSVLSLCVLSIWLPGSPFDPLYHRSRPAQAEGCLAGGQAGGPLMLENVTTTTPTTLASSPVFLGNITINADSNDFIGNISSSHGDSSHTGPGGNATCGDLMAAQGPDSYVAVTFFLAGIFLARFGVWMADLSITQLFLEKVVAAERGIVNGVQSSLNQLMNLLKFALVVALPDMQTFGFHILITFSAIATANLLYVVFARRERVPLCSGCTAGESPGARDTRDGGSGSGGGGGGGGERAGGGGGDDDGDVEAQEKLLDAA